MGIDCCDLVHFDVHLEKMEAGEYRFAGVQRSALIFLLYRQ